MNLFDSGELLTPEVVAGCTLVSVAIGTILFTYRKRQQEEQQRRPRAWSFTSTGLALGSFPARVQSPEHVINAALIFNECPSTDAVVDQVVLRFLEYERFAIIPEPVKGRSRHCSAGLDPSKLVRHIVIEGDKRLTFDTIQSHLFDPVTDKEDLPWWEVLIIENKGPGESACVLRIHHSLADGISLLHVVEETITQVDGSPVETILPAGIHKKFRMNVPLFKRLWSSIKAAIQVLTLPMTPYDTDTVFSVANKEMVSYLSCALRVQHNQFMLISSIVTTISDSYRQTYFCIS